MRKLIDESIAALYVIADEIYELAHSRPHPAQGADQALLKLSRRVRRAANRLNRRRA